MVLGTLDEVDPPFVSPCLNASGSRPDASALHKIFPDSMARILWHPHPSIVYSSIHLSISSSGIPECFLSFTEFKQYSTDARICAKEVEMNEMNKVRPLL